MAYLSLNQQLTSYRLFDSGTLHQYEYGHLYPNNGSKIIARTTTEDRMIQSAEYFLAGFVSHLTDHLED